MKTASRSDSPHFKSRWNRKRTRVRDACLSKLDRACFPFFFWEYALQARNMDIGRHPDPPIRATKGFVTSFFAANHAGYCSTPFLECEHVWSPADGHIECKGESRQNHLNSNYSSGGATRIKFLTSSGVHPPFFKLGSRWWR